jgi:hypothetical protein
MTENTFVTRVRATIGKTYPGAVILRANDRITQGIPDLLVWHGGKSYAIEAKVCRLDPYYLPNLASKHPALEHDFTGPQVVTLKDMAAAGVFAVGMIHLLKGSGDLIIPARFLESGMNFKQIQARALDIPNVNSILDTIQRAYA